MLFHPTGAGEKKQKRGKAGDAPEYTLFGGGVVSVGVE